MIFGKLERMQRERCCTTILRGVFRGFCAWAFAGMLTACGGGDGGDGGGINQAPVIVPPVKSYATVPTPVISVPLANEDFSSPTKNYQFFASDVALASKGYVEEEFFMQGAANAYDIPPQYFGPTELPTSFSSNVVASNVPYKTRIFVRRPANPANFNGTVVIEWLNVTDGFDGEYFWVQAKDYLLRAGYAYIGVSAQDYAISVNSKSLKKFSAARYGSLEVTGSGQFPYTTDQFGEQLSYDIFSHAAKAARAVPSVLNGLPVKNVIGVGMSQAGQRLGGYANYLQEKTGIFDAFLFQVAHQTVRDDLSVPVIKVLSETEDKSRDQDDTARKHTWWVAGTNHGDAIQRIGRTGVRLRDLGLANTTNDNCVVGGVTIPTRTRTPFKHVVNAAIYHLKQQVETGTVPPSAPRFEKTIKNGSTITVARDSNGNAKGAIRLAHMAVPTATADAGMGCGNVGAWIPFNDSKLATLYPTQAEYLAKVTAAVNASVSAGFVLKEDGDQTIEEAKTSIYGLGLQCGKLCRDSGHFLSGVTNVDFSTTGLLRQHTIYYNITNGQAILDTANQANLLVAQGYSKAGGSPERRANFDSAALKLKGYIDLITQAQNEKRVTVTAGNLLKQEANTIIGALPSEY